MISETGLAAVGGVLRDHMGRVIFAFASSLGACSIMAIELWAILKGVELAWDRGFRRLFVDSNSLSAISLLLGDLDPTHPCVSLVRRIQLFDQ